MAKKFNKENVSELILIEMEYINCNYNFEDERGSSQVIGKDEQTVIDYGKYTALKDLHLELFGNDKKYYS